jgi:hypothetical protein
MLTYLSSAEKASLYGWMKKGTFCHGHAYFNKEGPIKEKIHAKEISPLLQGVCRNSICSFPSSEQLVSPGQTG